MNIKEIEKELMKNLEFSDSIINRLSLNDSLRVEAACVKNKSLEILANIKMNSFLIIDMNEKSGVVIEPIRRWPRRKSNNEY